MIDYRDDAVTFSFPEVHPEAQCTIIFQRTLRIPDDGRTYPVPPGLGRFPLRRIEDFLQSVPEAWLEKGNAFFPMYQGEAAWLIFLGHYPFAVKVLAGGRNAITGRTQGDERLWRPRDYAVVPHQPWIDWFHVGGGRKTQFVAMPLEDGPVATGELMSDGSSVKIRIVAHPMKPERYREYRRKRAEMTALAAGIADIDGSTGPSSGWLMHRDCWDREFGHGAWDLSAESEMNVYPVNSRCYKKITGARPSGRPPTLSDYAEANLPWFEHYNEKPRGMRGRVALCC